MKVAGCRRSAPGTISAMVDGTCGIQKMQRDDIGDMTSFFVGHCRDPGQKSARCTVCKGGP
jgi:hypothetical protein